VDERTTAADARAFEQFTLEEIRRRMERTAAVCVGLFAGAWIIGRIALAGQPLEGPGRLWLGVLTGVAAASWLIFRYLPLAGRRPLVFALVMHTATAWGAAMHVSRMGALDSPFFYVVYTLPPLSISLPLRLRARILMTLAGAGTFAVTYFARSPAYLDHPMIHVPMVVLTAVTVISVVLGHNVHRIMRDRFLFGRRLERQQAQLAAHASRLEREVDDRSRALGDLATALESATTERADVARQLHDDLGQLIVGVRMELAHLERRLADVPAGDGPKLDYLSNVVETLDGSVRRFIDRLREPRSLPPLSRSLEELVAPLRARSELALSTSVRLETPLPPREREAIYRLVQEALTNAFKHAHASSVRVSVDGDARRVTAEVVDDGRGFDPRIAATGYGLRGLRERAAALGGELDIESGAGGTAIRLHVPLAPAPRLEASA